MVELRLCNPKMAVRFCHWASCGGASPVGALACEASRSGFKSRSQGIINKKEGTTTMWIIKIGDKFYSRGYNTLTMTLVNNKKFARKFPSYDKAESFANKLLVNENYEIKEWRT